MIYRYQSYLLAISLSIFCLWGISPDQHQSNFNSTIQGVQKTITHQIKQQATKDIIKYSPTMTKTVLTHPKASLKVIKTGYKIHKNIQNLKGK